MEAGASTEAVTSEETSTSVDTANDSEAFADAFATSEESTKAHTGGKIGKIHTITLENGKKQKSLSSTMKVVSRNLLLT